jgi:hypothetical protein
VHRHVVDPRDPRPVAERAGGAHERAADEGAHPRVRRAVRGGELVAGEAGRPVRALEQGERRGELGLAERAAQLDALGRPEKERRGRERRGPQHRVDRLGVAPRAAGPEPGDDLAAGVVALVLAELELALDALEAHPHDEQARQRLAVERAVGLDRHVPALGLVLAHQRPERPRLLVGGVDALEHAAGVGAAVEGRRRAGALGVEHVARHRRDDLVGRDERRAAETLHLLARGRPVKVRRAVEHRGVQRAGEGAAVVARGREVQRRRPGEQGQRLGVVGAQRGVSHGPTVRPDRSSGTIRFVFFC